MGHKFCGNCGALLSSSSATKRTEATLGLRAVADDGAEGEFFHLGEDEVTIGRGAGTVSLADPSVSPIHAFVTWRDDGLLLRDAGSTNGTYLRVRDATMLNSGDVFHIGEQFLRFESNLDFTDERPAGGAAFGGTPPRAWHFRLVQLLPGEREGLVHCSLRSTVTIGREGCDLEFPYDVYLTAEHCRVERYDHCFRLVDSQSRNGTFIRLTRPVSLAEGDLILVGRQLLRVASL